MADETKTQDKATKPKPYFERLLEHVRTKNFPNAEAVVSALMEFKEINAKRPKYYEKVQGNLDPNVIPFGKYKGKTVAELVDTDRGYLEWLVKQKWMEKFEPMRAVIHTHGIGQATPEKTAEEKAREEIARLKAELASRQ
jgi:hypothetical protein